MTSESFIGNLTNLAGNQTGDIVKNSLGILSNFPGIDLAIKLFQVAGALAIVYLVFLIIKAIAGWKSALRLKVISENVKEINLKLDKIVSKSETKFTKNKK
jgi:hypothetical protein